MDQGLKQRLVGAIVLIVIAVVFLPMLLREPGDLLDTETVEIPKRPKFEVVTSIVKPPAEAEQKILQRLQAERKAYSAEPNTSTENEELSAAEQSASEPTTIPLKKAWTIQLASFADEANANELVKKLIQDQYRAYREAVKDGEGKTVYRVFVGPDLQNERAQDTLEKLEQQLELKGLLVRFEP